MKANENIAMYLDEKGAKADRKLFVRNLGELLSQTRQDVISAELDDDEIVTVTYVGGHTRKINVMADSYTAIILDVAKRI